MEAANCNEALDDEERLLLSRCGKPIAPALKARHAAASADHYEARHGTSWQNRMRKANKKMGKGDAAVKIAAAFPSLAAKETGLSKETIRALVRRGRKIVPAVLDAVAETPLHGQGLLMKKLVAVEPDEQAGALARLLARETEVPIPTGERFQPSPGLVLINADSRVWMGAQERRFDTIATDWPYGVNWKAAGHGLIQNDDRVPLWAVPLFRKLLRRDGRLALFTSEKVLFPTQRELHEQGFSVRIIVDWDKGAWHNASGRPRELIIIADLDPAPSTPEYQTWSYPIIRDDASRADSPTPKPVEMMTRLLQLVTRPGNSVLDPFCGGTVPIGLAARELGLDYTGVELVADYFAAAKKRVGSVEVTLDKAA